MSTKKPDSRQAAEKCWKHRGVYGDSSCPELEKFHHCRTCPEYIDAGRRFYDREVPREFIDEWTEYYRKSKVYEEPNAVGVIVFRLFAEWFALNTSCLEEVTLMRKPHYVPYLSGRQFTGLVNLKGRLLPCLAVGELLGVAANAETTNGTNDFHNMIVVSNDGGQFVFGIHEIDGVHRIPVHDLKKIPATLEKTTGKHLMNMFRLNNKDVGLLDSDTFFNSLERSLTF